MLASVYMCAWLKTVSQIADLLVLESIKSLRITLGVFLYRGKVNWKKFWEVRVDVIGEIDSRKNIQCISGSVYFFLLKPGANNKLYKLGTILSPRKNPNSHVSNIYLPSGQVFDRYKLFFTPAYKQCSVRFLHNCWETQTMVQEGQGNLILLLRNIWLSWKVQETGEHFLTVVYWMCDPWRTMWKACIYMYCIL